jgi:hypothetical protein
VGNNADGSTDLSLKLNYNDAVESAVIRFSGDFCYPRSGIPALSLLLKTWAKPVSKG